VIKKVLVINSGSSSIKYELFDTTTRMPLASVLLEQTGDPRHGSGNVFGVSGTG